MSSQTCSAREWGRLRGGAPLGASALLAVVLVLAVRMALLATPALAVEDGSLAQLSSPFECVGEEREASLCGTLVPYGVNAAYELQVSPDGRSAYSVAVGKPSNEGAVEEYSRNPATGALTVIGCLTSEATPACAAENSQTAIAALEDPAAVAVSPSGESEDVYVIAQGQSTLVELSRDPSTGLLTKIGCITAQATSGECASTGALGLNTPYGIAVSPNGKSVYVTSLAEAAVAEFEREPSTGALKAIAGSECIGAAGSDCPTKTAIGLQAAIGVQVSPDGRDVYVAAGAKEPQGDVAAFERDEATGALKQLAGTEACIGRNVAGCAEDEALESTEALAISPDGGNVYANSYARDAIVELAREASGALEPLISPNACVTSGSIRDCTTVAALLGGPLGVAVSPGAGEDVYVTSSSQSAVAEFARNAAGGALEALSEGQGCVTSEAAGCGASGLAGLTGARRLTVSPDGTNVYVAGQGGNDFAELARATTPTVTAISPNQGAYAGGTEVTIGGSGFRAGDSVQFGGAAATSVQVLSAATIAARAPAGGETVDVVVTGPAGGSPASSADRYAYGRVGGLNLAGYCESIGDNGRDGKGEGPSILMKEEVTGPNYAYENWACVTPEGAIVPIAVHGAAPSMDNACEVAFPGIAAHGSPEEPNNAFSWNCYEGAPPEGGKGGGGTGSGPTGAGPGPTAKTSSFTAPIAAPAPLLVPAPVLARTGNVAPVAGSVLVRLPGASRFVALASLRQIPFGTAIEATHGTVSVTTALPGGGTQTGQFFDGEFILRQGRNGVVVAELTGGDFSVCPTARERSHIARASRAYARAAASGGHVVRKLWANAHGKFSTKGNYAAGAVQGTEWLTEDLCDGTLIRVTRDKVRVTNLVNHRHAEVRTGHRYLAKAP